MDKNYFIGLDIGTNSVGWAVTDEKYNLVRIKGKHAWGVRLFDKANTAVERRIKRSNRRRLDRRKLKLKWLQEIFKPELDKIDKQFLPRIKYSSLFEEDKKLMNSSLASKDSLFYGKIDGKDYTDKDFHKEYPTIYHLRRELTQKPAKDVRFLYLALHNIIKRRGHFLYEGNFGDNLQFVPLYNTALYFIKHVSQEEILPFELSPLTTEQEEKVERILREVRGLKDRKTKFYELVGANDKVAKSIIDIILTGKGKIQSIFTLEDEVVKFDFNDEAFDVETYPTLENVLTEDQLLVIDKLKELYSTLKLKKILSNNNYICEAMIEMFNTHHKQLSMFKNFIKKFYPSKKIEIFRNPLNKGKEQKTFTNYAYYIGSAKTNGKKINNVGLASSAKGTQEEFYSYITKILETPPETSIDLEEYEKIKTEIKDLIGNGNFLPKQRSKSNSVFPNKLYVKEVEKILNVNKEKFTFLSDKDDSGISNAEKILKILTFRIPYFVGPVGKHDNDETTHGWVERENNLPLRPWTIEKMVDFDKAEDIFIKRMTSKCTYLKDEGVLPKHSLLYSKFRVLNELNKLKINGDSISVELKQNIFNNLFKNNKKVSIKLLKDFFVNEGIFSKEDIKNLEISGIDKTFANDYSSYYLLKGILGQSFIEQHEDIVENIIKYITLINDRTRLQKRIKKEYGNKITDEQIKHLKALNFADWGRLSHKFLKGLKFTNNANGQQTTIIDEMWNTNQNLQEIIYNKNYTLGDQLEKENEQNIKPLTYENVEELYCSPAVKRGVWQAISIVNEIVELIGEKPSKIFVEVTRHDEEKGEAGRKLSRKTNLLKQYQSKEFKNEVEKINIDLNNLLQELNQKDDQSLRSEKLYLYFLQLGKCAYSGEPINLMELNNEMLYDIDHIIPQSIIKDDSINNKVLVKRELNDAKSDTYPISDKFDWPKKMESFWRMLVSLNLMTKEKFSRLIRREQLSNDEVGGFIARQLVETNQATKAVIDLLKTITKNPCGVVYSKAKFVSDFRKKYDIIKSRDVNDLHHAKDAYLNIVVGNVLFNRFTDDPRNFYRNSSYNLEMTKNIKKIFDNIIRNYRTGTVIWNPNIDLQKVKDISKRTDCVISKMSFKNLNDAFYDETIYKSKINDPKTNAKINLKGNSKNPLSNIEKYGGYNKLSVGYFMLIESEDKKHNKIKTIESVPVYTLRKYRNFLNKEEEVFKEIVKNNNLTNARILIDKINFQSTFKIDDGEYWLGGKTGNKYTLHNANQWYISKEDEKYVKAIAKYMLMKKEKKTDNLIEKDGKIILSPSTKEGGSEIALYQTENARLYDNIITQLSKPLYKGLALEGFKDKLISLKNAFLNLSMQQQAEVLSNIAKRLTTGASSANLTLLGDGSNVGLITMNKNITDKNIWLVKKSVTGLVEKYIKL